MKTNASCMTMNIPKSVYYKKEAVTLRRSIRMNRDSGNRDNAM